MTVSSPISHRDVLPLAKMLKINYCITLKVFSQQMHFCKNYDI